MNTLPIIEHATQRVLTTAQLAEAYITDSKHIQDNFHYNKDRYVLGKHYYALTGQDLKQFKEAYPEISGNLKFVPVLYLWTEKGALLHAKSLNTDKAWEVYERLVDDSYRLVTNQVPEAPQINRLWKQRLLLFNRKTRIPAGYWCIFNEIAHLCCDLEEFRDIQLHERAAPDISVALLWMQEVRRLGLDESLIRRYPHHYPDQRGVQYANIYPNAWLGTFRTWLERQYLPHGFQAYLKTHVVASTAAVLQIPEKTTKPSHTNERKGRP